MKGIEVFVAPERSDHIVPRLREFLTRELTSESLIVVVYLFGSIAKGYASGRSDLDMAFLLDEKSYAEDPLQATSPAYLCAARIGIALGRDTDVVILNGSSLEMAYEIVATGLSLYEADADNRLEYEAKIKGMYFDFKPFLSELRTQSMARL